VITSPVGDANQNYLERAAAPCSSLNPPEDWTQDISDNDVLTAMPYEWGERRK